MSDVLDFSQCVPMILYCPNCGTQHVDGPDPETGWDNPPHKSHLCHCCGVIWRPSDVATIGVADITIGGDADMWVANPAENIAALALRPNVLANRRSERKLHEGIEMTTIYAVTTGCYSAYAVVALFSTPELAREFMAAVPDSNYNALEEFRLNPNTADLIRRGYSIWTVHMLRDGNTEKVARNTPELYEVINVGHHGIWRRTQASAYKGKGIPDILTSTVWAKSEDQAVKIVNEHRAQMIASGEWS